MSTSRSALESSGYGIIAKHRDRPYPQWPRGRWLKIKCVQSESFMIAGYAGHGPRAQIIEITDEQWHTGMDVYLMNVLSSGGS
ncbi:UNVERIFIED_ORG: ATP-dependent DNA ligase [Rhizobium etli]